MSIDWLPSRKIAPKERGNRGFLPTRKNPHNIVEYESCLERNFLLLAIHCPSVSRIQHQPKTIIYQDRKGKNRNYTPDVFLELKNGASYLIEIKLREEIVTNHTKYEDRWKAAKEWSELHGIIFLIITDHQINSSRWMNVWFTYGASKCVDNDRYMKSLNLLIHPDGDEYNHLCHKLANNLGVEIGKAAQIICFAIYHGLVFVDSFSSRTISKDTVVRKILNPTSSPFKPLLDEMGSFLEINGKSIQAIETQNNMPSLKNISLDLGDGGRYKEFIEKREMMMQAWISQPASKRTMEWRKEFFCEWEISRSQFYRILHRYKQEGMAGLYPNHEKKGRRRKKDASLLDALEKARRYYLNPDATLQKAYRELEGCCTSLGIVPPTRASFYWYIYQSTTAIEFASKKGKRYLRSHFNPSLKSFQGGIMPMQVLQVDNTSLDVFPVDHDIREQLSPPYLTAAIDCYSGMIAGFSTSYFASSSRTILDVLVESILSKEGYTDTFETQQEWAIQGFPVVILVDNGMDYRSKMVKDFCIKHDIILEFVPLRTPRYKAYIEQWFNVLRNAMFQEPIPGFRFTLNQRIENPDLKPEKEAVLTLQEIETWLHRWIVDQYHLSNQYDNHVLAPYVKLKESREGSTDLVFPMPREPPKNMHAINAMYLDTLQKESRKLTRNGIQWEHLFYNSKELGEMHDNQGDQEVDILRDTRDVRRIWVINPVTECPILVGLGSGWAAAILNMYGDKPVHESAWEREVKNLKITNKGKITPFILIKHVSEEKRQNIINQAKAEQKAIRKEREKINEAHIKSIDQKLTTECLEKVVIQTRSIESLSNNHGSDKDIFKTYKPKGLNTSRYPKKA